jgi:Mlc titration factor MtfA (ptsG expression regulator)
VRVHDDGESDRLARAVGAVAFTSGQHVFLRADAPHQERPEGMRLMAHETAHVLQQRAGPVDGVPMGGGVAISSPSDPYEREAAGAADEIVPGWQL